MSKNLCRQNYLDRLYTSYMSFYDVNKTGEEDGLVATFDFNVHSEKYVLMKKAKLWETEGNEHVYVFSKLFFSENDFTNFKDIAQTEGNKKIHPKHGHMYSYITLLVICDEADSNAIKALKKLHIQKNYLFSFHGWMEFHAAIITLNDGKVYSNRAGKSNVKTLKELYTI